MKAPILAVSQHGEPSAWYSERAQRKSTIFIYSRKHGDGFFRWVHLSCSHESHYKVALQGIIIMKVIARSHCKESLQGVIARRHCQVARSQTCTDQLAQSNLRRATLTEQPAQSNLRRATCTEQLAQSQLHRASCTEQLAQSNLRRATCTGQLAQSSLHRAICAEQL